MDTIEVKRLQRKLEKARECDELKEAFEICMELGAYFASYEKYEEALDKYKEALSISVGNGWNAEAAVSQRMIAETFCSLGEYKEAVKHAEYYLDYSKKGKDKIEEQRGYATKGRIYFCWAEFLINEKSKRRKEIRRLLKESLIAYERSLKICESELNEVDMREKQEMKARLFQNLGLVMGSLGNYKEANFHLATAIQINKSQNFKENLYWCYINQGEYYLRAGEYASACTYFDLAVKATSSTENVNEALKLKAKSYLKMGNLSVAKNILREVYKQQRGKDEEVVEQLKIVVYLCKVDKMIDSTPNDDYESIKKLFEKKGDAFCALKQYGQGVKAYLKMLEYAEKCSNSSKDLLPCYSSLAQTYKDDEQYQNALFYCEKELKLLKENSVEACKTYLFLAELYELLDYDFETVFSAYKKAQEISQKVGDKTQEIIILKNMIQMQKDFGYVSLAEEYKKLLTELQNDFGDLTTPDGDYEGECDNTEDFMCDINDEELFSDVEDDKPRHQVRRNTYKVKRNQKGETELHVAAINGNYSKAKALIQKGHPVNEKDLAGWTVLHEACNHGHIHIVELLLNSGADINNPGGEGCGGITPLHDAAENGHFSVIKLLLNRGACPAILTNDGDTPLDCLKRWHSRTTLTDAESNTYRKLCEELKTNLDSLDSKQKRRQRVIDLVSSKKASKVSEIQSPRSPIDTEDDIRSTSSRYANAKSVSATELYISAIDGLRRKPNAKLVKKKISPLINEEDLNKNSNEEWLEDDMETSRQPAKRRKVLNDLRKSPPVKCTEFRDCDLSDEDIEMMLDNSPIANILNEDSIRESTPSPVFNVNKVKPVAEKIPPAVENRPITCTFRDHSEETGHISLENRTRKEKDNPREELGHSLLEHHTRIEKDNPRHESGNPVLGNQFRNDKDNIREESVSELYKFKIQVQNDVFLIPVLKSEMKELTIEWLAKETEDRYNKINGKRPNLLLMTEDDAIVSKDDPISLLVNEKIKTRVLGWKDVTLAEKYEEQSVRYRRDISLSAVDNKPDLSVMNSLNMFGKCGNLILTNLHLELREVMIVFEVLEREKCDVKVLDLSRNYLRDDGLEPLMKYLESQSVERLYLRSNGISAEGIKHFSRRLKDVPETNLNKILTLDFSYNVLRDASADPLNIIIEKLQNLECLGTENCCITKTLKELKKTKRDMGETDLVTSTNQI